MRSVERLVGDGYGHLEYIHVIGFGELRIHVPSAIKTIM